MEEFYYIRVYNSYKGTHLMEAAFEKYEDARAFYDLIKRSTRWRQGLVSKDDRYIINLLKNNVTIAASELATIFGENFKDSKDIMERIVYTCCICNKPFIGFGNNPYPVKESGLCCDLCNQQKVIPARLSGQRINKDKQI